MSIRSPMSPRGFVQLGGASHTNDNGIPLSQMRSNASSTGARKANQGLSPDQASDEGNEKHHFFHRGRRQAQKEEHRKKREDQDNLANDELSLNAMGKLYNRIIGTSVLVRYVIYIAPVALLLAVPLIVLTALNMKDSIPVGSRTTTNGDDETTVYGPPLFRLFVWIEVAWLTLWAGKLGAWFVPRIFTFFTGVVSPGTRKYATVLVNLSIPLSLFFWALADWLVFISLLQNPFKAVSWVNTVKTILGAAFVSSAIFLIEKSLIQLISISYHQRSFANRIQQSKRDVHLLGLMYDASRKLFPMYCDEFIEEDEIINDSIEMLLGGKKKGWRNRKSGAVIPARLIGNVGRFGNKVTSAFGNIATEITGKQVFNPNSAHSIVIEALEKATTSEALAKRIWMSFVVEGNEALFGDDITEVLGSAHHEEAEECFAALDADGNGDISLDEMIRKVVEIGKERKAIANSMQDIGQALKVFDNILLVVVLLLIIFVFLAFFNSSFVTTLATAGTTLLSLSFVFATSAQEFLGSTIFLFIKHPYDVGDRVDITGSEKEQLIVERISLVYTVFTRIDKMQSVQIPNIVLNNLWIENVSRSKAMKELIQVNVSYDTTFEDIELLRLEMEKFVRSPDNSRDFQPDLAISVGSIGNLDMLTLNVAMKHRSNWHNDATRAARRSKFMCALATAMKKVPMYGPGGGGEALGGPTNPTYSVSVTDEIAAAARDKAAQEKDAARLVPAASQTARSESTAMQELNAVDPVVAAQEEFGSNRGEYPTRDSRGASIDRSRSTRRSHEYGSSRSDLHKTESQRGGFRKAGESLPVDGQNDSQLGRAPSLQVTQHLTPFDEEAQVGGPDPYETYFTVPPPAANQPHAAQSTTRVPSHRTSVSGNRHRGDSVASVSRPPVNLAPQR
ncbi:serine/threonine protein kinase [Xylariaceae sp. FL1272]|nr:serine/threonine protein kinase [Xylariaceae sp. FL1272]